MLKENCKVGMKVTTVGDTMHSRRDGSFCCIHESNDGYITIMELHPSYLKIGYRSTSAKFKYNQVHPYWGDK